MTAATLQDLSAWTERESVFWYVGGAFRAATKHLALLILVPILFLAVLILAQTFPFRLRKNLDCIREQLPFLEDAKALELLRDALQLAFGAATLYRKYCLFRREMKSVISDLDETIDSLEWVLANSHQLTEFSDSSEKKASPDLPLPLNQQRA